MGCFQLSKGQCKELSSVAAQFWWGDKNNERKVHWISWKKMCESKSRGGMGFHDNEDFNQALLAKQAWRLVTNPDSLCARVLKARYFSDGMFWMAGRPKRSSYTWKSILHGRDLLKEGVVWRIGDGETVDVWEHNWIPRQYVQRPLGCKPGVNVKLVKELLTPDRNG
jgi:hypothetical protein